MPVYKLVEMPYDELLKWHAYFEKRPYGWREDDRAFKLISAQGAKVRAADVFPSLGPIYAPPPALPDGRIDPRALKRSALFSKMLAAKGGDTLKDEG
jgi:hypothetical protein